MKKKTIRILCVSLTMAILFSFATIAGSALEKSNAEITIPDITNQLSYGVKPIDDFADKFNSSAVIEESIDADDKMIISTESVNDDSAFQKILDYKPDTPSKIHKERYPDKDGESIGSFPTYSGTRIVGTDLYVYSQNNLVEIRGRGVFKPEYIYTLFEGYVNQINGLTIKESVVIGDYAFFGLTNLRAVSFLSNSSSIGSHAFESCTRLSAVDIPGTVTQIGESAFCGCTSLQHAYVRSGVANIGSNAFRNCSSLEFFSADNGLSYIADFAFSECISLKEFNIPANLTAIGVGILASCDNLQSVSLPDSLQTVGDGAFYQCKSLESVSMPSAVEFGAEVFSDCISLSSFIMPQNLTKTNGYTFRGCEKLESVTLPNDLTTIAKYDFHKCVSLEEIVLPSNLSFIDEGAFLQCTELRRVTFPENMYVTVNTCAFSLCDNLEPIDKVVKLGNIGEEAFYGTNLLKKIEFHPAVTEISFRAFTKAKSLESINFNGIKARVRDFAFSDCDALIEIINPPVFSYLGSFAFRNCDAVTEVTIDESCYSIDQGAFFECPNLRTINFGGATTSVGDYAFYGCDKLESISNAQNIGVIGNYTFALCLKLRDAGSITSVRKMDTGAFYGCSALTIAPSDSLLTSIESYTFALCESLSTFGFNDNITSIGDYAFAESGISGSLNLPANLDQIGFGAFGKCSAIETVTLSEKLSELPGCLFLSCSNLKNIYGAENIVQTGYGDFVNCSKLISVSFGSALNKFGDFTFDDCESLISLGEHIAAANVGISAFKNCKKLTSINMTNLSYIGQSAFYKSGIENVEISTDLGKIGMAAFEGCENLNSVQINGCVNEIGEEAFALCTSLRDVTLCDNLETIGNLAFYGCSSIENIDIKQGTKIIGNAAFYQCSSLRSINIPNTVNSMGFTCFKECSSLKDVSLSDNIDIINTGAFFGCLSLENVVIPKGIKEVGFAAFAECKNLCDISFEGDLLSIGQYAFWKCEKLNDFEFPSTLQSLGDCAFANCDSLTVVVLPRNVTSVGNYVFYQCKQLNEIKILGSINGFGIAAFYECEKLKDIYFYNGIPAYIGNCALYGVNDALTLHYNSLVQGWTSPQWTGPNDSVYTTSPMTPEKTGSFGDDLAWTFYSDSGILVISGSGQMNDYDGKLQMPWYSFVNDIMYVRIEDGVTSVGSRAFADCKNLRSVFIADSVGDIGNYAFSGCESMIYVRMPSWLKTIGSYAFYQCCNLNTDIPTSVEIIGDYAFFGCVEISYISIPDKLNYLGEGAFYNCKGLTEAILPKTLTEIKDYTFRGCISLKNVIIPEGITKIGRYSMGNCDNLSTVYIFGKPEIADYAFANSTKLKLLRFLGEKPDVIGFCAFKNVSDDLIAYNTSGWEEGYLTAKDGKKIQCVYDIPESTGNIGSVRWYYYSDNGMLLFDGSGEIGVSKETVPWQNYKNEICSVVINGGITSVGDSAFSDCVKMTKAVFQDGIVKISDNAFANCISLKTVTIPDGTKELGKNVFCNCIELTYVSLPNSVTSIPEYAFSHCESLQSIAFGDKLNRIGYSSFYGCESLDTISINASFVELEDWAFARCGNLAKLFGSEKISSIGKAAFFGCESLECFALNSSIAMIPDYAFAGTGMNSIELPNSVTSIGEKAFWGSKIESINFDNIKKINYAAFFESKIRNVSIPENLTSIASFAFSGCENLGLISVDSSNPMYSSEDGVLYDKSGETLIQFPNGKNDKNISVSANVKKIGSGAFFKCSFDSLGLPESIAEIGASAFAESSGLKYIVIPAGVTTVADSAFCECSDLEKVYFSEDVKYICKNAFFGCEKLEAAYFDGTVLQNIGESAFENVSNSFTMYYNRNSSGWNLGIWNAPDGNKYNVKYIDAEKFINSVTFNTNGGTVNNGIITRYLYGIGAQLPIDVTKENNQFEGWYESENFNGVPVTEILPTDNGDKSFYARWSNGQAKARIMYVSQNYLPNLDAVSLYFNVFTGDISDSKAQLFAAAYNGNKMIDSCVSEISLQDNSYIPYYLIATGGEVNKNTIFKVMLLSSENNVPLVKNIAVKSNTDIIGDEKCEIIFSTNPNGDGCEPEIEVPPEIDDAGLGASSRELEASITISNSDLKKLIAGADRGIANGIDVQCSLDYNGDSSSNVLTSRIDSASLDSAFGYNKGSIAVAGLQVVHAPSEKSGIIEYSSICVNSKTKIVDGADDGTETQIIERIEDNSLQGVSFCNNSGRIMRVRGSGFYNIVNEEVMQRTFENNYTLILPYLGLSNIIDFDADALVDAVMNSTVASKLSQYNKDDIDFVLVSFIVKDGSESTTYFKLKILLEKQYESVKEVKLVEFNKFGKAVKDGSYNPIAVDETYEPDAKMPLEIMCVSPNKGSNGKVTIKINGSMIESGAKPELFIGNNVIEAEKTYWLTHDKLYATFDLTNASDGVYSLRVKQKEETVTQDSCFTLDSSLPKGELAATINIDKSAAPGTENKGSVTYTNTGYTDVYSPVIYIDTADMVFREDKIDNYFTNQTVFVCNSEGLAGIIANGETASYNFFYTLNTSRGFAMNVYNFADVDGEINDPVELNEESEPGEFLAANLQSFRGIRGYEYAEKIAKMACQLDSIGDGPFDLSYLENAFLADAQGTLIGESMVDTEDIVSRDMNFSRHYVSNVVTRQKDGLFGKGWFSDLDETATYQSKDESGIELITVNSLFGITYYEKDDQGVFKESVFGESTAEYDGNNITIKGNDGSYSIYKINGKLCRSVDKYGNFAEIIYNNDNKPIEYKNGYNDSLKFEYTDDNLTRIYSTVTNDEVTYSYDEKGRLIHVEGMNGTFDYSYINSNTMNSNCLSSILLNDSIRQAFVYDDSGRISEIVYDDHSSVHYDYPGENTVIITDSNGNKQTRYYNAAGRLARTVSDLGNSSEIEYGKHKLTESVKSGLFTAGEIEYDENYNISKITSAENTSVSMKYDGFGNITSVTDEGGKTTEYLRNEKGEGTDIIYPDGSREQYTYDSKGNIHTKKNRDGKTITFEYNEFSMPIKIEFSTGDVIKYSYDGHGNNTSVSENGSVTTFEYDNKDQLSRVKYPNDMYIEYTYDKFGNLIGEKSNDRNLLIEYKYEYDKYNRLSRVYFLGNLMAEYTYNGDGTLKKQLCYNGTYTEYKYSNGALSAIYNYSRNGDVNSFFEYSYDKSGNIVSIKDKTGTWTYGYDSFGQLSKAVSPNGETILYSIDYSGNRISATTGSTTVNYNSNQMNQYTSVGNKTLSYDENGNLVSSKDADGTTTYEYDYADRLIKTTEPGGRITSYTYDAFGLRSSKGVIEPGSDNEVVTNYLNSSIGEGRTMVEITENQFSYYTYGLGMIGRIDYNTTEGGLYPYIYSYNHLGSTAEITSGDGTVVNSYTYNQEGKVTNSVEGVSNNLTYVGKYGIRDDKNGLYYDRARYISQNTMSFISPDPLGQISDLNLYRYAGNDPVHYIDICGKSMEYFDFDNPFSHVDYEENNIFTKSIDEIDVSTGSEKAVCSEKSTYHNETYNKYMENQEKLKQLEKEYNEGYGKNTEAQKTTKQSAKGPSEGAGKTAKKTGQQTSKQVAKGASKNTSKKIIKGATEATGKKILKKSAGKIAGRLFLKGALIVGAGVFTEGVGGAVVYAAEAASIAQDVYDLSMIVSENWDSIIELKNKFVTAVGEAANGIKEEYESFSAIVRDYSGNGGVLKTGISTSIGYTKPEDIYEYPAYYGDMTSDHPTPQFSFGNRATFNYDSIYSNDVSPGITMQHISGTKDYSIQSDQVRTSVVRGFEAYYAGVHETYADVTRGLNVAIDNNKVILTVPNESASLFDVLFFNK